LNIGCHAKPGEPGNVEGVDQLQMSNLVQRSTGPVPLARSCERVECHSGRSVANRVHMDLHSELIETDDKRGEHGRRQQRRTAILSAHVRVKECRSLGLQNSIGAQLGGSNPKTSALVFRLDALESCDFGRNLLGIRERQVNSCGN
jgi:hypothetical protein